jgi:Mlc titration factor MtfA (ptsG expression regulator)
VLAKVFDFLDFKARRWRRIRTLPFPDSWIAVLEQNVVAYRVLSTEEKTRLHQHIAIFLHEKTFEGAGGLEVTDEIRVTIAAYACLLILNRPTRYYPTLRSIIVYPRSYLVRNARAHRPDGTVVEGDSHRLGESWHRGSIVLSWDDVRHGGAHAEDGRNVAIHEFAHQLDGEYLGMEGAPLLHEAGAYGAWARVLGEEYDELVTAIDRGRRTLLGSYAATNPAEFFAVATELFFERPLEMRERHPALYDQLQTCFAQDPARRNSHEERPIT